MALNQAAAVAVEDEVSDERNSDTPFDQRISYEQGGGFTFKFKVLH